jgi:signal transduction histidine kinase
MVRLAVEELLENAIKFNNKLEKIIKVQVANHGDSISISVRDYGVGIRPQDVSLIFEPFYQVDDYFTGQVNGWGLGLPMVQRILNLHKGSISVVSDRGLGSIFTLSFPL